MIALIAVYDATFAVLGVLVLWFHKYLFDGGNALEMILYAILTTYVLQKVLNTYVVSVAYRIISRALPPSNKYL